MEDGMSREKNQAIAKRWFEEMWSQPNILTDLGLVPPFWALKDKLS
jgi:hypothetical protein